MSLQDITQTRCIVLLVCLVRMDSIFAALAAWSTRSIGVPLYWKDRRLLSEVSKSLRITEQGGVLQGSAGCSCNILFDAYDVNQSSILQV